MSTYVIKIKPNPNPTTTNPAVFNPQAATVNAYDTITWRNADKQPHWPAPSASNSTGYMKYQIPAGATSSNLSPGPNSGNETQPYTLNYVCVIHPAETGTIIVNPAP